MSIRTLELTGTNPRHHGQQHGEACRDDVRGLYELRLRLMLERTDLKTEANVCALAERHLPILKDFSADLHAELEGIAEGSGLSPAQILVLNHYTDLRDLGLKDIAPNTQDDPGGCSAWFVDDGKVGGERFLGQTWDMHGSATPYALVLRIPHPRGELVVFTITGCLGMTGLSSWGTSLTINNLNSLDATLGVVWPAMVRACVQAESAKAAFDLAMKSPIGSGRHYIFADETDAFAMETSGTKKKAVWEHRAGGGRGSWIHTNHCVDDEMKPTARILPTSTTLKRYDTLKALDDTGRGPTTPKGLFDDFGKVSMAFNPDSPDDTATCGALVMDLRRKEILACKGLPGPGVAPVTMGLKAAT